MTDVLDLEKRLRPGLDILATEIVICLKKRKRYKQNVEVYEPGLVKDQPGTSLLRYMLHRLERVHAELGRFTYASQQAFSDVSDVPLVIMRPAPPCPIKPFRNDIGDRVIDRYVQWVRDHCETGSDSDSFGEAVTTDVDALLNIQQRINIGMLVAESKFRDNPTAYLAAEGDPDRIRSLLVNPEREAAVVAMAGQLGEYYEVEPQHVQEIFEWMIATTVNVEVRYLQMRAEKAKSENAR